MPGIVTYTLPQEAEADEFQGQPVLHKIQVSQATE